MRIRSIRPEFWSSEDVADMDWDTRLVYIGLWSYVDDNGVGRDSERLVTAALFPLDADFDDASRRVTGALLHLSDHGQITRYVVHGRPYLHVAAWSKHQRIEKASKGRYPLPTCDDAQFPEPSLTTPGVVPEMSTPGEGEKGRRGEGEKGVSGASAPEPPRIEIEQICKHLADCIEANGSKRPTITTRWRNEARLMLDRDGRTVEQVTACIDWLFGSANRDAVFWRTNVRAMPKLRAEYDRLRQLAERAPAGRRNDIDWDLAMERARVMGEQR